MTQSAIAAIHGFMVSPRLQFYPPGKGQAMSSPAQPPAYDAVGAAQKQGEMNKQTAVTQFGLNATNQVTPQGNLAYRQIGTWDDGTPRFEATQSLSPGEQSIYNTESRNRLNLGRVGDHGFALERHPDCSARPRAHHEEGPIRQTPLECLWLSTCQITSVNVVEILV